MYIRMNYLTHRILFFWICSLNVKAHKEKFLKRSYLKGENTLSTRKTTNNWNSFSKYRCSGYCETSLLIQRGFLLKSLKLSKEDFSKHFRSKRKKRLIQIFSLTDLVTIKCGTLLPWRLPKCYQNIQLLRAYNHPY